LPGSFHDSKASLYVNIYKYLEVIPEPYCLVSDGASRTGEKLKGKKFKEDVEIKEGKSKDYIPFAHFRQWSSWGTQV
jgi:hypothetical protein